MKNKILIVAGGLLTLLLLILIVRNCGQVKETQVVTKGVMKETVKVLDSISNVQKNETIKKDSANAVIDTMSATNKRKRAKDIFKRRKKERLGFVETEDDECRKLLDEERQSKLRRTDRRLQQNRQRAERKKQSAAGRKDTKQVFGRQARKPPDKSAKGK
jgi:DNA primase large subunit